ncbi:hypothetical protein [Micromonospora endolithica]|uniref:Uncharacterized protein n=1 Tax=Micromonospora endolithica TaxID=230091 RepID=A0A3A9ZHF1_9ACTN|nr:hypothetical protein [Micromonospora endolithica]RKN47703.1 hypothetical protein D7223_13200 [Micromonospora endolithica]TWJ21376.1 hypothetical protein JD76_01486 [Micromonospora endolithica]
MTETKAPTGARMGTLLRRAAAMEVAMWRSLFRWALRRPLRLAPGDEPFGYLGPVKPILGVLIGLSVVEIPVLDLIVANVVPWTPARWIALGLGVWGVLWMVGLYAGMRIHPHVVGDRGLRVRAGSDIDVWIPWTDVQALRKRHRSLPSSRSVQVEQEGDRRVLCLGVGSQTSVDVVLRRPTTFDLPKGRSEPVDELRLHADDPDGLLRSARGTPTTGAVSR